ncbi:unnamed protein product [Ixodes hexagonus]
MTLLRVGLCPELTAPLVEKIRDAGIRTVVEFLSCEREEIAGRTGLPYRDVIRIRRSLVAIFAPTPQNGASLYDRFLATTAVFSTGSRRVDDVIGGGVFTGQITEIVGASTSGKTQLCHSLTANAVTGSHFGVLYIDTLTSFSAERIRQILCATQPSAKPEQLMQRICHLGIRDIAELVQLVDQIRNSLERRADSRLASVKMIVVDSLKAAVSPVLTGDRYVEGLGLLAHLAIALQYIAARFRVAVVVTNDVVTGPNGMTKPALGKYWADVPSLSLEVSLVDGLYSGSDLRQLLVTKSLREVLGSSVKFRIANKGVTTAGTS